MHTILLGLLVFAYVVIDALLDVPRKRMGGTARLVSIAAALFVALVALNVIDGLPDTKIGPLFEHRDLDIAGMAIGFVAGIAVGRSARSALAARLGRKAAAAVPPGNQGEPPAGGPPMGGAA